MTTALFEAIQAASQNRSPDVLRTPLQPSVGLSNHLGCNVLLKAEHLQTTWVVQIPWSL
ncbi:MULTISPECIES: hypothetical protein [unclassified Rhizobium]|uniref:hypothetical protein n=1 Tax=Rhizobium sp. PP-CC-3G-465 TaxID=2135648 RepID=UPI000D840B46|nr:hypothetical protein C8J37_1359 [Rhizobium sp. PP-WC-1G-195]TCQ13605.1 hypothetical protein C8J33_1324 [Rhizobium sp. PP-CC-3G-465]